jgi:hypothetical protein
MRRIIVIWFAAAALFSGCAYDGVIVEKRFRPLPFSESLGMDAIHNFQLRDSTGQIHSQMVTPDVFASYRAGDYFNDLQSPPSPEDKEPRFRAAPPELNEGPYQPVRVMRIEPRAKSAGKVAAHTTHQNGSAARTAKVHYHVKHTSRIAHHKKNGTKVAGNHQRHQHHKALASLN